MTSMNRLVVLKYSDQARTDEAIRSLRKMHSDRNIKFYASAAVVETIGKSVGARNH